MSLGSKSSVSRDSTPGLKLCGAASLALNRRYDCPMTGMSHCAYGAMICAMHTCPQQADATLCEL